MTHRVIPILLILGAIGIFFGYINPTYTGDIAQAKSDIESYDAALTAGTQFSQKEAELTNAKAAIPADKLARLEAFLPDGVDNVQLILDLDALAARSGMTLSNFSVNANPTSDTSSATPSAASGASITPDPSGSLSLAAPDPVDSLQITLSATGTYSAFRTFLAGIEQSLRPLDITSLTVTSSKTGVYTYDLTINIYWLK